jgi:hypothetical protein
MAKKDTKNIEVKFVKIPSPKINFLSAAALKFDETDYPVTFTLD